MNTDVIINLTFPLKMKFAFRKASAHDVWFACVIYKRDGIANDWKFSVFTFQILAGSKK